MNSRFRLKKRSDFERVRQAGKSYAHPFLVLMACRNESDLTRIGVSAGRGLGGAVQRSRAKRRLRALLNSLTGNLRPGWDLVIIARKQAASIPGEDLDRALRQTLRKARVFAETSESNPSI